jgi:hypothetical protein
MAYPNLQAPGIDTVFRVRSLGVFLRIDEEPIALHDVYRIGETIIVSLLQRPPVVLSRIVGTGVFPLGVRTDY